MDTSIVVQLLSEVRNKVRDERDRAQRTMNRLAVLIDEESGKHERFQDKRGRPHLPGTITVDETVKAVYEVLKDAGCPLKPMEIHNDLRQRGFNISLTTLRSRIRTACTRKGAFIKTPLGWDMPEEDQTKNEKDVDVGDTTSTSQATNS